MTTSWQARGSKASGYEEMKSRRRSKNVRDSRVDEIKVALELRRDRVCKSADESLSSLGVLEDLEVGIEHLVCLAYGNGECEPVARWRDSLSGHPVRGQKLVHKRNRVDARLDVFFNLSFMNNQRSNAS